MIILALKGANQDFFVQSPHCAANCIQHVHSSGPGATERKSCAAHTAPITCNNNNNNNNNRIQRRYSRFFTISSQRRELSPTHTLKWPGRNRVQITCSTSSTYTCKCHVTCHLVRRDSSAIKFDRIEIAFI